MQQNCVENTIHQDILTNFSLVRRDEFFFASLQFCLP